MRVSILVAAYNAENFIGDTMQSVQQQTYADWELIVVDDGSTDLTAQKVEALAVEDTRIRLIRQRNAGAQIARNCAFAASQGEYIVILDADDRLLPAKLALQVALLDAHPECGLVYGDTWHCDETMAHVRLESQKYPGQHASGDVFAKIVLGNLFAVHAAMVRRDCLLHVGLHDPNPELIADWDLWVRVAEHYAFLYHPEAVAEYRIHGAMSARTDVAHKQYRQRMGMAKKIMAMPRFIELARKQRALFAFANGRFAHKFGLYGDAIKQYMSALGLFPFCAKPWLAIGTAILAVVRHQRMVS